jgi:hypothetical protein
MSQLTMVPRETGEFLPIFSFVTVGFASRTFTEGLRIRIKFNTDPDLAFYFYADPVPILLLIKVIRIYDHFEPSTLIYERPQPTMAPFRASKAPEFLI